MADKLTPARRSWNMSRIRGKDTTPELQVRRYLHARGFRYSLHAKLPGRPDIVLRKYRSVILVHGCFWHCHGCSISAMPKTRPEFWAEKLGRNVSRDAENIAALEAMGWQVIVVWECEVRGGFKGRMEEVIAELGAGNQEVYDISSK